MPDSREIARQALLRADEIKRIDEHTHGRMKMAAIVCVCAMVVVGAWVMLLPNGKHTTPQQIEDTPVPLAMYPLTTDETAPDLDTMEEGGIVVNLPGYSLIPVLAETPDAYVTLYNPVENEWLLSYAIELTETKETLYMSSPIAPSMSIENIALSRPLEKGLYKAVLIIRAYEADSLLCVSTVCMEITIDADEM